MTSTARFLWLALACAFLPAPAAATTPAPDEAPPNATFLVIYRPGPAWLPGKPTAEQPLKEHGRYMLDLYLAGAMKQAGPLGNDAGGAVLLEVADEAEARALVAQDPAVISGLFVHEIHRWHPVPWETHARNRK